VVVLAGDDRPVVHHSATRRWPTRLPSVWRPSMLRLRPLSRVHGTKPDQLEAPLNRVAFSACAEAYVHRTTLPTQALSPRP